MEIKREEVRGEVEIRFLTMGRKQGGTKICIIQQKTSTLHSLVIDCQLGVMCNLEVDKIMFQVHRVREGVIHWWKIHSAEFSKHKSLRLKNPLLKEPAITVFIFKNSIINNM